jgi:paraquat-inducible protein A
MGSAGEAVVIACHDCDALQREVALAPRASARCWRCGAVLYRSRPHGLDRTLAYTLGSAALFVVANSFPIVALNAEGNYTSTTLFGTAQSLYRDGIVSVAALVFLTTIAMPAVEIAALLYMLLPLKFGRAAPGVAAVYRTVMAVRPWGMVEVFMIGLLVALTKLASLASVVPGVALWSIGGLMFLIAAAAASFDSRDFWARMAALR